MSSNTDRIRRAVASEPEAPFRRPSGRVSFPRRVTLDLTEEQHAWLRHASWEHRLPAADLLRAATEEMEANPDFLEQVIARAGGEPPVPAGAVRSKRRGA